MKLAIILSTTNVETNWNAFRFANFALGQGDEVKIFLVGEGVEYEKHSSAKFNLAEQITAFLKNPNGKILACGTCLKAREQESTEACPISTLKDLHALVKESDKILTF
ncbi:MAG: hypothetical protein ACD_65C00281G0003 [uncultured bacterium]|nr:MAG: hypothetical protein ACD_65C00281G0003 [uncultured bacterium]